MQIATTVGSYQIGIPAANARKPVLYVSGGAFRNASKDMVYAIWMDLSQTGCTPPGATVSSSCKTRIWFSRSANGGANWSTPVMINNQSSRRCQPGQQQRLGTVLGQFWAWDRNAPSSTLNVDVYNGSNLLGSASAGSFRQDLLNAGIGNGYHGFGFALASSLWDGNTHTLRARFGGTTADLSSTPRSITCTTIFTTQTPQYYLAGSNYENSTNFSSSANGYIVALRFYKAPGETGTHVGNLWSNTGGSPLASMTFTNETSSGWQTQFLTTPVAITAGTTYRVSYGFNNYLSKTDCGLSGGITHGPLTTTGSSYSTPNGTFPNTGSCSNFFADVIFSP